MEEHIARIKQYLLEKTDEELFQIIEQKNNPDFLTFHVVQELKKRKDERERRYRKDIATANEVLMGRKSIQRLSPEEESGRIEGGKRNVEASIIIGTSGRTNEKNESKSGIGTTQSNSQEQEQMLKDYARNVGIWLNYNAIAKNSFKQFPSGAESKVFLYKDENNEGYIIKVTDYKIMEETPMSFIDNHISLANYLSPETKYELLGFTEHRERFCFVVKQFYVDGGTELEYYVHTASNTIEEEIKQYNRIKNWMKKEYKAEFVGGTTYENERYIFNDLHLKNVLEKDDKFYLIDLIVRLNIIDRGGGNAEYLPLGLYKLENNSL